MKLLKQFLGLLLLISLVFAASATQEQLRITLNEYVDQEVHFNPLGVTNGTWVDTYENQSYYNLTGYIIFTNENPNNKSIFDIYVSFDNVSHITLPTLVTGRNGTWVDSDLSDDKLIIHIPELNAGENTTWVYSVNESAIRPPLNFTSAYSDFKLLAGDTLTVVDTISNAFDNHSFQTDTCIYDINITQEALDVNFSGTFYPFYFNATTINGTDAGNVTVNTSTNKSMQWTALGYNCLNKNQFTNISYDVLTPTNVPTSRFYEMINSTLRYKLNQTISHLKVIDITAISEASFGPEKKIQNPSHPILYGSNVTWNVTGYFDTATNITYNLTQVTLWVSQRNVNGAYTDPNTIDNDTISNETLNITYYPNVLVNTTNPWTSQNWMFNYSDIPSPIVWMDINFTIQNDGTQLINRSVTQNGNDYYIKELYLIVGYWLEIEKNVTSLDNDTYFIRIDVHNKGNQATPAGTVVTIYDFVPNTFNRSNISFGYSTWYSTVEANNSVNGGFNGTLYQWGLLPNNTLNTSFAQGPAINANTTWWAEYNVTGLGDYEVMDVFVTGLDPQRVDGAGSSKSVVVSEVLDRISSTEGVFAVVAGVLLLLGLLL